MFDDFGFDFGLGGDFGGAFDMPGLGGGAGIFAPPAAQPAEAPTLVADASGTTVPLAAQQPVPSPSPNDAAPAPPKLDDGSNNPVDNPNASMGDLVAASQKRLGLQPQQEKPSAAPPADQAPMAALPKSTTPPAANVPPPDQSSTYQAPTSTDSKPPASNLQTSSNDTSSSASRQPVGLAASPGRSPNLTGVDPRLQDIVANGATYLPDGYSVKVNEGYNPNGHAPNSQHHIEGSGALDIQIFGPDGQPVPNRGTDESGLYTRLAQGAYTYQRSAYPDLNGKLAWGGAFETSAGSGTPDLMHFDLGGERGRFGDNLLSKLGPLSGETRQASSAPQGEYGGYLGSLTSKYNLPEGYLSKTATLESHGNPNDVSDTGAAGVFQFTKGTAKEMGVQNRFDPYQSADGAARYAVQNQTALTQNLGRAPTGGELYLAHQQGAAGAAALLKNPDANVVDALAPAYGGSRAGARQAVLVNGGNNNMTAGEFASKWTSAYDGAKPTYTLASSSSGPKTDQDYRDMYPNAPGLNSADAKVVYVDGSGKESDSPTLAWWMGGKKNPGLAQKIAQATDAFAKTAYKQQGRGQAPKMNPAKAPVISDDTKRIAAAASEPLPMNWQG
ncbi:transglycosylase SLT domain-containing protein [Bradyrhizobium sp. SZCCHNRI3042]|uniref:transglycosylase SLT domain-containing protein n=1 Tax=Bradyrhizobium sp. SZCCHNRI3042 TaxID=3057291 RepID=UPI0029162048|nr:transglycosylase SLT domain-containing protein [Bradyrhizobium sp. SZCCHNRI3042]